MARPRRFGLIVALTHLSATLLIGYIVLPYFQTMQEPPPPPPPYAPLVLAVTDIFYFPIISFAEKMLMTDWAHPGLAYVVANSALAGVLAAVVNALIRKARGAVA